MQCKKETGAQDLRIKELCKNAKVVEEWKLRGSETSGKMGVPKVWG